MFTESDGEKIILVIYVSPKLSFTNTKNSTCQFDRNVFKNGEFFDVCEVYSVLCYNSRPGRDRLTF
jgi:hypothetical protein